MECDLREVLLEVRSMNVLERLAGSAVQLHPARGSQLVVERVPDEDVGEAEAARRVRNLVDESLDHGFVEDAEDFLTGALRHAGDRLEFELSARERRPE
jgi:hypothetical protein